MNLDIDLTPFPKNFVSMQKFLYKKKKKKLVHIAFDKPLMIHYNFSHELINFIEHYWCERKRFFSDYYFIYLHLNQSLKWKNGYTFLVKEAKNRGKNGCSS